jgi:hypothetical protein
MTQGVIGSFDLSGDNLGMNGRIFYEEQYDPKTGKHTLSITGISIQSPTYGQTWYPHGSIAVNGEVVGEMDNTAPASHQVSITAGSGWHKVALHYGTNGFPWVSSEFKGNQATISVTIIMYRDSSTPRSTIQGSVTIDLTAVQVGGCHRIGGELYRAYIGTGAGAALYDVYIGDSNNKPVLLGQQ